MVRSILKTQFLTYIDYILSDISALLKKGILRKDVNIGMYVLLFYVVVLGATFDQLVL